MIDLHVTVHIYLDGQIKDDVESLEKLSKELQRLGLSYEWIERRMKKDRVSGPIHLA